MFRLYLFTRICLLKLVPSVKCPFLLFTQVRPLLQQPMGDPALTDTCKNTEQNKKKTERGRENLFFLKHFEVVYTLIKGVVLQSPGTNNVSITEKVENSSFPTLSLTALTSPCCYFRPYWRYILQPAQSTYKPRGYKLGSQIYHWLKLPTTSPILKFLHLWNGNKSPTHFYTYIYTHT